MGLVFGVVMTAAGLITVMGTLRHRSAPPSRTQESSITGLKSFLEGFLTALHNQAFRKVWLSFSLFFLAVVMSSVVAIHYFTWYVKITDSTVIGRIQTCFYLGALVGVTFWVWRSKHTEKCRLYLAAILATACLLLAATLLFGEGSLFGIGNPIPLFFGYGLAGFFASALWVLPGSMLADVADQDEIETGLRREGILF